MNGPILRALFLDAYYQVLDNKVFRILAVLVGLLVLPTFVLGAREEGLVILFGVKTISWDNVTWLTGTQNPDLVVQNFQDFVVGGLAGTIGILFSIAATAFFVPRMLEKGAADVVFSRPVSRTTLLCARYCAGVLFVALLASTLVFGMYLGLRIVSGRGDPAFLWSILTIVYVFALVHSVSLLVGVLTRSAVAGLLVTILFFTLNGCVHNVWILSEFARDQERLAREEQDKDAAEHEDKVPPLLYHSLDTLHFILPKTTDSDLIVRKLRRAILESPPVVRDSVTGTRVAESPENLTLVGAQGERDLEREPALWQSKGADASATEITFRRESRVVEGRRRSARTAARTLSTELEQSGAKLVPAPGFEPGPGLRPEIVCWEEKQSEGEWSRARAYVALGDWLLVVEVRQRTQAEANRSAGELARSFTRHIRLDENDPRGMDPARWYEHRLDWSAPLRHNIFFSVGSSVLFALLLFALAAWKLKRIDF